MRAHETRAGGRHMAKERGYREEPAVVAQPDLVPPDEYREHGRARIADCLPLPVLRSLATFRESLAESRV